ncbi:hypothetical protein EDD85DRAFT_790047 [Armillaria nabsnona]|nr:hypothetical protein EDD85DRAFT_790047 [Armillaria nabsnona]
MLSAIKPATPAMQPIPMVSSSSLPPAHRHSTIYSRKSRLQMTLKKKFGAAWKRVVEASQETGRRICRAFGCCQGLNDAWDQRTPRQIFHQQRGLASNWDHFREEYGRFMESGEEDSRFTESTEITYLAPLCTVKDDVYAIGVVLNTRECPNFTLTIDIWQYRTRIA